VDPEKGFETATLRKDKRAAMIDEVAHSVPVRFKTSAFIKDLEHLIHVRTWGTESFEFAHFTPRQLAIAIRKLSGPNALPHGDILKRVEGVRRSRGNLEKLWEEWPFPKPTKPTLALELWSLLQNRLIRFGPKKIPIARVVEEAIKIGHEVRSAGALRTEP